MLSQSQKVHLGTFLARFENRSFCKVHNRFTACIAFHQLIFGCDGLQRKVQIDNELDYLFIWGGCHYLERLDRPSGPLAMA